MRNENIEPHLEQELKAMLFLATQRLNAAAKASQDAVLEFLPDGTITTWNAAAEKMFGHNAAEAIGQNVSLLVSSEKIHEQNETIARVMNGAALGPIETKRLRKNGTLVEVSATIVPVKAQDGSVVHIVASIQDISGRKHAEREQKSMTRELTHRIKNAFAVLQSILHFTLRNSPQPEDFAKVFTNRLHSLSATQDILTANDWKGVELGALARHQLAAHQHLDGPKLQIKGPEVYLAPQYATPFGLIFNELAANALKHGAWSVPTGTVELTWRIENSDGVSSKLHMCWQERGGPAPSALRPPGLGVVLIEKGLSDAQVVNTFEVQGLTCTIELEILPLTTSEQVGG